MKFGLESEKFLFDLKHERPSQGVFRFIDALSDIDSDSHITNEFVLNMVEIVTPPSETPMKVLSDYLLNYFLFNSIVARESVTMVGMGSLPMVYQPHMTPKWPYVVQNSILEQKFDRSFVMDKNSPLTPAGNCAGIHVHAEISTLPEYLFSTRELQDKFNLGLMMTPLSAFASSPYFFGEHGGSSMRAQRYFNGVYREFPLNGGLPPVMESSAEVLNYFKASSDHWIRAGVSIGLSHEDLERLVAKKGASWNPIRWNRVWNTIELRCLDSDRIDYDCSKFIWVIGAMKRLDPKGEALECRVIHSQGLNDECLEKCFTVSEGKVNILSTAAITELFQIAIKEGVNNPNVRKYLEKLSAFAEVGIDESSRPIFNILLKALQKRDSTSNYVLSNFGNSEKINTAKAVEIVRAMVDSEKKIYNDLIKYFPATQFRLEKLLRTGY